ncbi:MAG TPA: LytTR family DNA-binding domain-containing protein [Allosphingosinicella sp.]|nr:LytTR family DNA-binding domain-containing protein [Allosphingosinicella sp.]
MAEIIPLRVMVVDDEPLAVERLQLLLARCPGATVAGTANDGEAALRIAEAVSPDLVLLDIAMPGMDGIDVARALSASPVDPAVVFVTAFDNFAVAAFDVAAIDYLMKPVQLDRLQRALERVREHLAGGRRSAGRPVPTFVEEFWVPDHSGLVRIAASDIHRITAERDYMRLHVGTRSWLIHRTIGKLEEDLDPALFIRVHRSVIVRRDTVTGLYRDEAGHWTARLRDGGEQRIGRSYIDSVKRLAGR